MLIATDSTVFHMENRFQAAPSIRFRGGRICCVAEGGKFEVIVLDDRTVVILAGDDMWQLDSRIDEPIESVLIVRENPLEVLLGTEGAHLYRLHDMRFDRVKGFDALDRSRWHTPWAGPPAVRSMAATPDSWVYSDIHVGSIMRSKDAGSTWQPVRPDLDEDVHQVTVCPAAPDHIYANTAKAVYISRDRGNSWQHCGEPLGYRYGRAIAVAPREPGRILATVSNGPHGSDVAGQLYLSEDSGETWHHIREGFPASVRKNINTHWIAFTPDSVGWAAYETTLYIGLEGATRWRSFWESPEPIAMIVSRA